MYKILLLVFVILFCFTNFSYAGDDSVSGGGTIFRRTAPLVHMRLILTSDGSGNIEDNASGNPITVPRGFFLGAVFTPDAGDAQPDDEYNVYLRGSNDFDWLFGVGVGLEQSITDTTNVRTPFTDDMTYPNDYPTSLYINASGMGADNKTEVSLTFMEFFPNP